MSPSRPFVLRPVATTLLMVAITLSGLIAYRFLPMSALPEVDYPTIQVQTFYPGASPDVMTSSVTAPLEVQLGQMPGLRQMSSVSSAGASVLTLQFAELALQRGRDCRRHHIRAGAGIEGEHLDGRVVDLGQRRNGQLRISDDANQQDCSHQQRSRHRAQNKRA